jgi:hypothetical protein
MKHAKPISLVFALFLLTPIASAQTRDWQAVKSLQPATKISVHSASPFHNLCIFERATDEQLVCEHIMHGPRGLIAPSEYVYERKRIREVRLEHGDATNMAPGVAIGGGVGVAIGASRGSGSLTREGGAFLIGGIGALVGGTFGREFPIIYGKVIYRH